MESGAVQFKDWMARRQVNQRQAAKMLGWHWTVLWKILSGRRRPTITRAIQIQQLTGISVEAWLPTNVGAAEVLHGGSSSKVNVA